MQIQESARRQSGTSLIELGPTLWIVFIILTFPMLTFGTLGLRYTFLWNTARIAAQSGALAKTFLTDNNAPYDISATNTVTKVINAGKAGWNGITVNSYTTSIIQVTNATPPVVTSQSTKLSAAANQSAYTYLCLVTINASLAPLFPQQYFHGLLACPGLSTPLNTTAKSEAYFEFPSGLNQ